MPRDIISNTPPPPHDPYAVARAEIAAAIDGEGRPTGDYWQIMGMHAARQTKAIEKIKGTLDFFLILFIVGVVLYVLFAIVATS